MSKIGVLIIDDSALLRRAFGRLLAADPELEVLGAAADPIFAERYLARRWPDVIVLDLEMPRMDGLTFLKRLMRDRPTPVVICSSLTQTGARATLEALANGAFATVAKPQSGLQEFFQCQGPELVATIKAAAQANLPPPAPVRRAAPLAPPRRFPAAASPRIGAERIVLIGTSTGGVQAIEKLLGDLPAQCPPLAIVQHMPAYFTKALAERLDHLCAMAVSEAQSGEPLLPGRVLIAPGDRHLLIQRRGRNYRVRLEDSPPVNRHRPSVDALFHSAVREGGGANMLVLLLTGMGADGAEGLLALRRTGAHTLAQDEASSVVFGMPRAGIEKGGAEAVLPLERMGPAVMGFAQMGRVAAAGGRDGETG